MEEEAETATTTTITTTTINSSNNYNNPNFLPKKKGSKPTAASKFGMYDGQVTAPSPCEQTLV